MAEDDYTNSSEFGEEIIDTTLDTLRDQDDQEGTVDLWGRIELNPQQFAHPPLLEHKHLVLGPFLFDQPFSSPPFITYGETPERAGGSAVDQPSSVFTRVEAPFLSKSYTYGYRWTNGVVDGFYVGLYALTAPPAGSSRHSIDWRAVGPGSRYNQQDTAEAWSEGYDQNDAEFLEDTVDESDNDTVEEWTEGE